MLHATKPVLRKFTPDEVKRANDDLKKAGGGIIFSINGKVYDVSKFVHDHPGGPHILQEHAGTDASQVFEDVSHSDSAEEMLLEYQIGEIEGYVQPENTQLASTPNTMLSIGAKLAAGAITSYAAYKLLLQLSSISCAMVRRNGKPLLVVLQDRFLRPVVHRATGRVRLFRLPDTTSLSSCDLVWKLLIRPNVLPVPKRHGSWRFIVSVNNHHRDYLLLYVPFLKLRPSIPVGESASVLNTLDDAEVQRALTAPPIR